MEFLAAGFIEDHIVPKFNYWIYVILMMIGLYAMITKNNLIKKLIGMAVFQTAIILFYVSIGVKEESGIPILSHGQHHAIVDEGRPSGEVITKEKFANPLPHVLMLNAIVVGVSTLGLALAITLRIYSSFNTLEEDGILVQLGRGGYD